MSTLIMSTGAFCTETAIDYPNSYLDINDSYLYPTDFDLNVKENQLSKSLEEQSIKKNTEQSRVDCMNNQSSSNLLSSEFMTSSYYQLTTESPALPHTSTPESSLSTIADTMSTTVSSQLDQRWSATMDTYTAPMVQQQHASIANTPQIDSAMNVNVSEMTSMDYFSPNTIGQMPLGNLPGFSQTQPSVSSFGGSQDLSFLSLPSDNFNSVKDAPENSFNELLLPSISETGVTASLPTIFNNPSTTQISQSGSFFSQSSEFQLSSPLQQSAGNLTSSPQTFSAEILPTGSSSRKMKASVSARHRHTLSQSSGEFNRVKQYRHHSYSEGRRRSNITPPSPLIHQELYKQPTPALSFEGSAHSWPSFESQTSLPSPQSFKKNFSYVPEMSRVKQEFSSQHSLSAATPDEDYISTLQGQQLFQGFSEIKTTSVEPKHDYMVDSPSSLPATGTYSQVSDQSFNSPHQSPIHSIGSPHSMDYVMKSADHRSFKKSSLSQHQISERSDSQESFSQYIENVYESQSATSSRNTDQYLPDMPTTFPIKSQSRDHVQLGSSMYNDQMFVQRSTNYNANESTTFATPTPPQFPTFKNVIEKSSSFATPSPLRPSSEGLCAVCGDNAACQHYGVRTCEGCKGFFKRTVQKKSTYVCLANKNCPVDKRRRNRCQFCRFEKCLAVGMVKEVVRTANLKGRRGRLPSKPKGPKDPVAPPSPPVSFITSLVRAHIDTNPAITNTDLSQYRTPGMPPCSPMRSVREESQYFFELLASCLLVVRQWAEKIPGFCSLKQEDQTTLIESSFLEIFALRLAYRLEIQEGKFVFCNGIALHRDQLYSSFGDWTDNLISFACTLSDLNVDISSFSCMLALTLFQDRAGIRERQKVEEMRRLVLTTLKEHVSKSLVTADRPNFFMKLLSITPDLAVLASAGARRLYQQTIDFPAVSLPRCLQRGMNTFLNV